MFGWGFEDEREAVIVERGIVVEEKRDVESGRVPLGEVIFPFRAGLVLRGDGFFVRRVAEVFERVGSGVEEHGNFDELAAIDDEIGGFAIAFRVIEIGRSRRREFGALAFLNGVEKVCARGATGIFAAYFYFVAGLALETQKRFDGLADVMAVDFDGRRCRGGLLGDVGSGDGCGERYKARNELERRRLRQIESHTDTISRRRGEWLN